MIHGITRSHLHVSLLKSFGSHLVTTPANPFRMEYILSQTPEIGFFAGTQFPAPDVGDDSKNASGGTQVSYKHPAPGNVPTSNF